MQKKLIIVDDFYSDPQAAREFALGCTYSGFEGQTFAGGNSAEAMILPGMRERFKEILGPNIEPTQISMFGNFRISRGSDHFEQDVHIDPPVVENEFVWAAVLYLNTPEQCMRPDGTTRDGTLLWRHKRLNIEQVPLSQEEGQALGFADYDAVRKELVYGDGLDRSKWELMHRVPAKFNRIAFFRPWHWHSHGENFGTTAQDSRLVQLFFFRKTQ